MRTNHDSPRDLDALLRLAATELPPYVWLRIEAGNGDAGKVEVTAICYHSETGCKTEVPEAMATESLASQVEYLLRAEGVLLTEVKPPEVDDPDDEPFLPDWVSPPGDTIRTILRERRMSRESFANEIGMFTVDVEYLLIGRTPIDEDLAKRLAGVLGSSPEFWLRRDAQYRADSIRLGKPIP